MLVSVAHCIGIYLYLYCTIRKIQIRHVELISSRSLKEVDNYKCGTFQASNDNVYSLAF